MKGIVRCGVRRGIIYGRCGVRSAGNGADGCCGRRRWYVRVRLQIRCEILHERVRYFSVHRRHLLELVHMAARLGRVEQRTEKRVYFAELRLIRLR